MPSDDLTRDTIAAVATPAGRGGVGVVRVSGPAVPRIAAAVFGVLPEPRVATFGVFRDSRGEPIDEGLALYFPAPLRRRKLARVERQAARVDSAG